MIVDTTKREAIMLNYTMKTDAWKQIRPKEKLASTNSYSFILKKNQLPILWAVHHLPESTYLLFAQRCCNDFIGRSIYMRPCPWVSWVGEAGYYGKRVSLSGIRMLGRASVSGWCWGGISDFTQQARFLNTMTKFVNSKTFSRGRSSSTHAREIAQLRTECAHQNCRRNLGFKGGMDRQIGVLY